MDILSCLQKGIGGCIEEGVLKGYGYGPCISEEISLFNTYADSLAGT